MRWLDRKGNEQVRVNIQNGHAQVVSQDALQNKATYYYFQQALRTPADVVYISPIDLNVEQGRIVTPFQPTLRATILTGEEDGLQPGVLIINFNLAPFLNACEHLPITTYTLSCSIRVATGCYILIVNRNGASSSAIRS